MHLSKNHSTQDLVKVEKGTKFICLEFKNPVLNLVDTVEVYGIIHVGVVAFPTPLSDLLTLLVIPQLCCYNA
jgi:hypothetical protein